MDIANYIHHIPIDGSSIMLERGLGARRVAMYVAANSELRHLQTMIVYSVNLGRPVLLYRQSMAWHIDTEAFPACSYEHFALVVSINLSSNVIPATPACYN